MRPVHMCRCGTTLTVWVAQWIRPPRTMALCSRRCWGGCPPAWQARLAASGFSLRSIDVRRGRPP
eukprot:8344177-Alexandrium_andersonii.AAC.1